MTSRNFATGIPFKIRQPASAPILMQQPGNGGSVTAKHTRYLKIEDKLTHFGSLTI